METHLGRPVGSGNNELRNIINESINPNKIREMLNKIEDPVEYINAINNKATTLRYRQEKDY